MPFPCLPASPEATDALGNALTSLLRRLDLSLIPHPRTLPIAKELRQLLRGRRNPASAGARYTSCLREVAQRASLDTTLLATIRTPCRGVGSEIVPFHSRRGLEIHAGRQALLIKTQFSPITAVVDHQPATTKDPSNECSLNPSGSDCVLSGSSTVLEPTANFMVVWGRCRSLECCEDRRSRPRGLARCRFASRDPLA
jgi:hypothetical protein